MSLKAVHILFITVATLVSAGFGVWAVQQYLLTGSGVLLTMGVAGLLGAVALPVYGVWFLKKMKKVSFL